MKQKTKPEKICVEFGVEEDDAFIYLSSSHLNGKLFLTPRTYEKMKAKQPKTYEQGVADEREKLLTQLESWFKGAAMLPDYDVAANGLEIIRKMRAGKVHTLKPYFAHAPSNPR